MGKRRVIAKTEEEVLKENEKREAVGKKATQSTKPKSKKSKIGQLDCANIYVQSTYNNTLVTLTTPGGDVVAWASAGSIGFKGPKKATPYAASKVVETLMEKLRSLGVRRVNIFVKGVGSGRDAAVRSLASHGFEIESIKDVTPIPHNGCRPPKPRRV